MSQTVQGHYGSNGNNGSLVGVMNAQGEFDAAVKKQLIPQPNDNNKTLVTASGGVSNDGSNYYISFCST